MARTKNVPKGQELANWQEEVGAEAKAAASTEKPSGGKKISTAQGKFSYGGATAKELDLIVLAYAFENAHYTGKYDADNPQPPSCFAIELAKDEESEDRLAPHDNSYEKQCDSCVGCDFNKFGSDPDGGKGKGCKNTRKLAVIPASALEEGITGTEIATLSVSPTNIGAWKGFVSQLGKSLKKPPIAVITRVAIDGYQLSFSIPDDGEFEITAERWDALKKKREEAYEILLKPYDKFDPEAQTAPKAGKSAPSARAARFTGKPAAAPAGKGAPRL